MNFLAHLYLADPGELPSPAAMIGNVLPDLVRGPVRDDELHPDVAAGAHKHRRVDAFTDTHPIFARSRARIRDRHGRFSGILIDVFYDHILARQWPRYHDAPLGAFIEHVHDALRTQTHLMPQAMRAIALRIVEQDWLACYATLEGIERTLSRMSRRLADRLDRQIHLERAVLDLRRHHGVLVDDFHGFFSDAIEYVGAAPTARAFPTHL